MPCVCILILHVPLKYIGRCPFLDPTRPASIIYTTSPASGKNLVRIRCNESDEIFTVECGEDGEWIIPPEINCITHRIGNHALIIVDDQFIYSMFS